MTQNRPAPAYQEFAANMMARTAYRVMSLESRGLLYSLRLECWVNGSVPANPAKLARVLGYAVEEVARALPELVDFFVAEGDSLRCPELDDYRAHLQDRKLRQSAGGKAGAAITNGGRQKPTAAGPSGNPASTPTGNPRVARESLVQISSVQPSPIQYSSLEGRPSSDDYWIEDYEHAERE